MLYKIKGKKMVKVTETKFKQENKLEQNLEDWIENNPSILGENLLIIGRQVHIQEVNDRIDLLALDTNGNVVIIELKRGKLKDPVDIQSLRYASYISRWEYEIFEKQARNYFFEKSEKVNEFNFNEIYEEFCSSSGIDIAPDLNQDQKIIIVGSKLKEKLGSVALWLREHNIDIKIIEVSLFKDGDSLFLTPQIIIPIPTTEKYEIGKHALKKDRPWLAQGAEWHLEKRCGKNMKEKLIQLNSLIKENFQSIEGPNWNQKFYISFKFGNHIWIYVNTHKNTLILNILIKEHDMDANKISEDLGIVLFEKDSSLSEKLQLNSSIDIYNKGVYDKIIIRIKEEFDIFSNEFIDFIRNCLQSFKKI